VGGSSESLNVKGAYFEVLSDMLGSVGVIAAAIIVMWTGWKLIDPIVGAGIGLFIVPRTWKLLGETVHILLEGVPEGIDFEEVRSALRSVSGVEAVHDLHIWTITSGVNALSAHLEITSPCEPKSALREAREMLKHRFQIDHITIQIEAGNMCEGDDALRI